VHNSRKTEKQKKCFGAKKRKMRSTFVSISLLIPGIIHILPLYGVLGSKQLEALYGLKFIEPNLSILMRHRAVMFGLLGSLLIHSAFVPTYRMIAFYSGLISASSFLILALSTGGYNSKTHGVVLADTVALGSLFIGYVIHCI
jgi:hypothetical protein